MKKLICLILCFCLLTAGCGKIPAPETQPITPPTEVASNASVPAGTEAAEPFISETIPALAYQNPLTAVSLIPMADSLTTDSGTILYRRSSADLYLTMNDYAVADSIAIDFQHRSGDMLSAATEALNTACKGYSEESDWTTYFCDLKFDVARIDQTNLSLIGTEMFFDGTPLSGQSAFSLNYDMLTGTFLTLKDVLAEDFSADALVACILEALANQKENLFEDYTETIAGLFATNTPVENWYLTGNGLCFYFNPYEIAPQNKGIIYAEIPYRELVGILKDAYFPAEAVEFSGNLIMSDFADADTDSISQFAEAVLDDSGTQHLIYSQGTVLNVRVETGTWTKSGAFVADSVIFCAEALTAGNALMLQLNEADLGKLCITYQTGREIIRTPWQTN